MGGRRFFDGAQEQIGSLPIQTSATQFWLNVNGTWKKTRIFLNVDGVWRQVVAYLKQSGIWS